MLLERNGKLTMWKSKSSRLSYSQVESLSPLFKIFAKYCRRYLSVKVRTKLARSVRKDRGLNILLYEKQTRLIVY